MKKEDQKEVTLVERTVKLMVVTVPQPDGPAKTYRFTAEDSPVTVGGYQYIPLSTFDQQRYAEMAKEKA